MTFAQAVILGIVQGLTEFIPVSSSGHLVLVPHFLGWEFSRSQAFIFDVLVQWGTLLAVFIYFWKDLTQIAASFVRGIALGRPFADVDARMGWYLILATLPAVIAGIVRYGWGGLGVIGLAVASAMAGDALGQRLFGKPITLADGSAIVSGLLFGMLLPAGTPMHMVIVAGVLGTFVMFHNYHYLNFESSCFNPCFTGC